MPDQADVAWLTARELYTSLASTPNILEIVTPTVTTNPAERNENQFSLPMVEYQLIFNAFQVSGQSGQASATDYSISGLNSLANKEDDSGVEIRIDATHIAGLTFTAGVVSWALRVSGILAGFLASVPAWRNFDAMPIMRNDGKKDEDWLEESTQQRIPATNPVVEEISVESERGGA
ncbi:MAG: hypothetical protein HGB05_11115 [Chloroflexi bacterium]|nr:hypothetical protein [Chloroflexota bacterium]